MRAACGIVLSVTSQKTSVVTSTEKQQVERAKHISRERECGLCSVWHGTFGYSRKRRNGIKENLLRLKGCHPTFLLEYKLSPLVFALSNAEQYQKEFVLLKMRAKLICS